MPLFADGRIPVSVVADEAALAASLRDRPGAAVLTEAPLPDPPGGAGFTARVDPLRAHPVACTCCTGRLPVAQALDALFLARVKGEARWFDRVVAFLPSETGRQALAEALRTDGVVISRYRAEALPDA